jgi:hypothetical protein
MRLRIWCDTEQGGWPTQPLESLSSYSLRRYFSRARRIQIWRDPAEHPIDAYAHNHEENSIEPVTAT